ncbi:hypothetical protein [Candidatus Symbiopectobacterium sp. 'North America']|uniref:hypothetical protein n=1 Tax=Candidatus Symbiopectobacterium sp. 'North America' TaxID=2794574 RepID=UPI001B357B0B|nr:hypothetical protein [Candidatus Symbiopectobacterium sp. 'North America']
MYDDTLNHTQQKDNFSLINEIITINNEQGLNECNKHLVTKEYDNKILLSMPHLIRNNNDDKTKKVSKHRMLKRILGLIVSVTSIISLWKIGESSYHKDNQLCLSIDKGLDLLNDSPIRDIGNASDILLLKLYKNDRSFYNIPCDDVTLSQHEYLKKIVVIENLSLHHINDLYQFVLFIDHKRITRSIPSSYEHQVNASEIISNIINNNDIDWRIREEFKGGVVIKLKIFLK